MGTETPEVLAVRGEWGVGKTFIEVLSALTVDDFYQIFISQNGDHLSGLVDACLQFAQIDNASDEEKMISNKTIEVLVKIGKQSSLNARRVAKFGIRIEGDI